MKINVTTWTAEEQREEWTETLGRVVFLPLGMIHLHAWSPELALTSFTLMMVIFVSVLDAFHNSSLTEGPVTAIALNPIIFSFHCKHNKIEIGWLKSKWNEGGNLNWKQNEGNLPPKSLTCTVTILERSQRFQEIVEDSRERSLGRKLGCVCE